MKIPDDVMEQLAALIKESSRSVEVCVPSTDYYRRSGDWQTRTIEYIDPEVLISVLQNFDDGE